MRYALVVLIALAACATETPELDTVEFISYNGVSEPAAHVKCDGYDYGTDELPALHAACVRMVRADYCGDGTSWTEDGVPINVYDHLEINTDDAPWDVDATWSENGALCVNRIRDFREGTPACFADLYDPACGGFDGGALIVNEVGL